MTKRKSPSVVVTGLSGYVGSFLRGALAHTGHRVVALEKTLPSGSSLDDVRFLRCDITKPRDVLSHKNILKRADTLIHLASYVPLDVSQDEWRSSIRVNIEGSMNVAELLPAGATLIFASTCEVYGTNKGAGITESYLTEPSSWYGISKLGAERCLKLLCERQKVNLIVLRFASVYGPGEKISRAIPNFIKAALRNQPVRIFGNGGERRTFLFGSDAAEAILRAMRFDGEGVFNIASKEIITIRDLALLIIRLSRSRSRMVFRARRKEPTDIILDTKLAARVLRFTAKTALETGLAQEIEFFRERHGTMACSSKRRDC